MHRTYPVSAPRPAPQDEQVDPCCKDHNLQPPDQWWNRVDLWEIHCWGANENLKSTDLIWSVRYICIYIYIIYIYMYLYIYICMYVIYIYILLPLSNKNGFLSATSWALSKANTRTASDGFDFSLPGFVRTRDWWASKSYRINHNHTVRLISVQKSQLYRIMVGYVMFWYLHDWRAPRTPLMFAAQCGSLECVGALRVFQSPVFHRRQWNVANLERS